MTIFGVMPTSVGRMHNHYYDVTLTVHYKVAGPTKHRIGPQ